MKDIEQIKMAQVESKGKLGKGLLAIIAAGSTSSLMAVDNSSFANSDDSFGQLLGTFILWLQGNLGKLLALLGFIGTFIIYLMTHKGSVLFIGAIISVVAGGLVGIVGTFFNIGTSAFTLNAAPAAP